MCPKARCFLSQRSQNRSPVLFRRLADRSGNGSGNGWFELHCRTLFIAETDPVRFRPPPPVNQRLIYTEAIVSSDVHRTFTAWQRIRKLKSGKVNVQVRREGHPPVSATFQTRTEAKAWATKIEDDINHGKDYGFSRVRSVADAIDAFTTSKTTNIKTADDRNRLCSAIIRVARSARV